MLQADLDDEHRARLAHELPTDLDSSPSSQSSGVPPSLYDTSRRRPKAASRHRSHTTTEGSTTSTSRLLARLLSAEEEVREINGVLLVTTERLETESSRADAAERRALDYFHRLRLATENCERTEQDCTRLREELKLYKMQLDNAQKEIFRAQDIIDQVSAQRNEAEADAAKARTKARKLQEERLVMFAREEGRRVGYREGLSMGRRIGFDQGNYDDHESILQLAQELTDEEHDDPRPQMLLRSAPSIRQRPARPESAPPVRTDIGPPLPIPARVDPVPTPSHGRHTPSPPRRADEPETIRPIPIRASPDSAAHHIVAPPDGWIPRSDSRTSYIAPPPQQPSPIFVASELEDNRRTPQPEPTSVPPPVRSRDYAYQPSVPPPVQRSHTPPSLASRSSTHISQYDLVSKRPGSSLRNEIYLGRAGSGGSQPSRSSTRNEHRDSDRNRTEAENIVEQWRADSDVATPQRNPPRSYTPASSHSRRPVQFYSRAREIVTPTPLGDIAEPQARSPDQASSGTAPPDDHDHARSRSPFEYLRKRLRQRPSSAGSSIPNIVVESPSEPETAISPSATAAAQPELLSPEAANRPLPQEDPVQARPPPQQQNYTSSTYDHSHSGVPWPAGFVPYPGSSDSAKDRDRRRSQPDPAMNRAPQGHTRAQSYTPHTQTQSYAANGYPRARTQSASSSGLGRRGRNAYEAAPLPEDVIYPAPPSRPHTSHSRHREQEGPRDRDWERHRERDRSGRERNERDRPGDRSHRQREEREEDLTKLSPAALARPLSLFSDSEDER